jgi:hypothetical protein
MPYSVLLGLPHYGELAPEAIVSLIMPSAKHTLKIQTNSASLLAHNFNLLWCAALNQRDERGLTHFAMHHADIHAKELWLDDLLDEMDRVNADVLSCIVPLKDDRGLTSTAFLNPATNDIRRLTMQEAMQMPETFDRLDRVGDSCTRLTLLINTGLWVCRFDRPWVEKFPGFTIKDHVYKDEETGRWKASVFSEDWNFSKWCAENGVRVFATRKIPLAHYGRSCWRNDSAWGNWATDKGDN